MKKILSLILSVVMICSLGTVAFAAEDHEIYDTDSGITSGVTDVTLEVVKAADILIATVPIELPIVVDTRGNVTVPTDAKIINNAETSLEIIGVAANFYPLILDGTSPEELKEQYLEAPEKYMALSILGQPLTEGDNDFTQNGYCRNIIPEEELNLELDAAFSAGVFNTVATETVIGTLTFVLGIIE